MIKKVITFVFVIPLFLVMVYTVEAKETQKIPIPSSVLDISKENTYPNPTQDLPKLQPSELAEKLLKKSNVPIDNPKLKRLLNESSIKPGTISVGYRVKIYLGHWALNYASSETAVNWEYKKVNTNFYDNRSGRRTYVLRYSQQEQSFVRGGLTTKIESEEDVKQMMLIKATEKTNLPLAYHTIVGANTKRGHVYHISPKQMGYLQAFAPAVNEKGNVTFGDVYLVIKGNQQSLEVKNATSHGIGAWIPIQDHLSFMFIHTKKAMQ